MSNETEKIGQKLVIALARELSELTGETPSCLHAWMTDLDLPKSLIGSRQTFYSRLEDGDWRRKSEATATADCHLCSSPFSCRLRLRAVSLAVQFSGDVRLKTARQVIVLMGYETCSQLFHFRFYRGMEYEKKLGVPLCEFLPVAVVASFVEECARMVGLPLKEVLFTQRLTRYPALDEGKTFRLSLSEGKFIECSNENANGGVNEIPCRLAAPPETMLATLKDPEPFVTWCQSANATALLDRLSKLAKAHNGGPPMRARSDARSKTYPVDRLEKARKTFKARYDETKAAVEEKRRASRWQVADALLTTRLDKHPYALRPRPLHDVKFFPRKVIDFGTTPGD